MNPIVPTQQQFDLAYWASQPPAIQALQNITNVGQRMTQAEQLAQEGYIIDVPIMAEGLDPFLIMTLRLSYGYTWVPGATGTAVAMAPGLNTPGLAVYNPLAPPPNSIKVSISLNDYPPYELPPAPSAPIADPVGPLSIGNTYLTVSGDTSAPGTKYTDSRGTFVKVMIPTPFGFTSYWKKIA